MSSFSIYPRPVITTADGVSDNYGSLYTAGRTDGGIVNQLTYYALRASFATLSYAQCATYGPKNTLVVAPADNEDNYAAFGNTNNVREYDHQVIKVVGIPVPIHHFHLIGVSDVRPLEGRVEEIVNFGQQHTFFHYLAQLVGYNGFVNIPAEEAINNIHNNNDNYAEETDEMPGQQNLLIHPVNARLHQFEIYQGANSN